MNEAAADRRSIRHHSDRALLVLYATVRENIARATAALLDQDTERAEEVIASDGEIDIQCQNLTGLLKNRLSSARLTSDELEELIAVLQIIPELERSADLAEHIAQRARAGLGGAISPRARGLIQSMCDTATQLWVLSGRAYAERSRDITFELNELDDELDDLSATLLVEGASAGVEPGIAAELALIARFYERVGDHAVNLGRRAAEMGAPRRLSPLRTVQRRWSERESAPTQASHRPGGRSWLGRLRPLRIVPKDSRSFEL